MLVRVSTRNHGEYAIGGDFRHFAKLPVVGEYLAMNRGGEWYQVELVIHCPFPCEWVAEIFAVQVDHNEIKSQVFADAKGSPVAVAVQPDIKDRLIFVSHDGQWVREMLDESGQIYDYVGLTPAGAMAWLEKTIEEGRRLFDHFESEGAKPVGKDQVVAALRRAADELERAGC